MARTERLQKILAAAGIASRRKCESYIRQGRVSLNGRVVTELGVKADPERDHIKVDGRRIRPPGPKIYLLLNKPRGVISAVSDPHGRTTVRDLVRAGGRIFHVGRLDCQSEGLILLTNDGELARIVGDGGERFPRVYHVKVRGVPDGHDLERVRAGVRLADGTQAAAARLKLLRSGANSWLEVTLTEGKNREIRKMFEAVGHPVVKLRRKRIGFLTDRGLAPGSYRPLSPEEVAEIYRLSRRKTPQGGERRGRADQGERHREPAAGDGADPQGG